MQHSSLAGQVVEPVATALLKARMHEAVRSYSSVLPCGSVEASHEADQNVLTGRTGRGANMGPVGTSSAGQAPNRIVPAARGFCTMVLHLDGRLEVPAETGAVGIHERLAGEGRVLVQPHAGFCS